MHRLCLLERLAISRTVNDTNFQNDYVDITESNGESPEIQSQGINSNSVAVKFYVTNFELLPCHGIHGTPYPEFVLLIVICDFMMCT